MKVNELREAYGSMTIGTAKELIGLTSVTIWRVPGGIIIHRQGYYDENKHNNAFEREHTMWMRFISFASCEETFE